MCFTGAVIGTGHMENISRKVFFMNLLSKRVWLLGVVFGCFGLPAMSFAAPIVVPNFSFEKPDVPDGGAVAGVESWTFIGNGGAVAGIHDQLDDQYAGATDNLSPLPGSGLGNQNAFIQITPAATDLFGRLFVEGLGTVEAGMKYELAVALGNRLDADAGTVTLMLTVDGSSVASLVVPESSVSEGTFADFSVGFSTLLVGDPNVGGELGVELRMDVSGSGPVVQGNFDNVRVEATVPEPGTFVVLAVGGVAMLIRRRNA